MMNKQNILYTILVTVFYFFFSQVSAQTKVGVRTGVNLSNVSLVDENNEKQDTEPMPRFQIGLSIDIPIISDFYLQPAVLYSGKGFKQVGGWLAGSENEFKAKASYIEVPVNLLYKPQFGRGRIIVGAGPYIGHGTGGKWEADGQIPVGDIVLSENSGDVIFKNDVSDGEFGNYLYGKPWDYGANIIIGYEFLERLSAQLNAQFGIANLKPKVGGATRDGNIRNKGYGISVGYSF